MACTLRSAQRRSQEANQEKGRFDDARVTDFSDDAKASEKAGDLVAPAFSHDHEGVLQ
jgi:hypothetical protein